MQERRRHTRFVTKQFVWCETDRWTVWVRAVDLSAGGVFVQSPRPPAQGGGVRLILDGIGTIAKARVAWRSAASGGIPGMGLEIRAFERGQEAWLQLLMDVSRRAERMT